jgi:hypothetical protein
MAFNWRVVWNVLSILLLSATAYFFKSIWTFREEADRIGIKYNSFSDLWFAGQVLAIILVLRMLGSWAFKPMLVRRLERVDRLNFELKKHKITREFLSFLWYVFASVYGNVALYQHPYIPSCLNGSNTCEGLILDYGNRSGDPVINRFYMIQSAHHMYSLIEHLFITKREKDFAEMALHHLCAMSAIIFSYFTNQIAFGATILLIHDYGDIFLNLGKILKDTKLVPPKVNFLVDIVYGLIFISWFGPRVFLIATCVLPAGIYYRHFDHKFDPLYTNLRDQMTLVDLLQIFLVFVIMLLNLYWSYVIVYIGVQRIKAKNGADFVVYSQGEKAKPESPSVVACTEPAPASESK